MTERIDLRGRPLSQRGCWVVARHGGRVHRRAVSDLRTATIRAALAATIGGATGDTVARRWAAAETLQERTLNDRTVTDDRGRLWIVEVRRAEVVTRRSELDAVIGAIDAITADLRVR